MILSLSVVVRSGQITVDTKMFGEKNPRDSNINLVNSRLSFVDHSSQGS